MTREYVLIRLYRLGDLLMASALARAWKREAPTRVLWIVGDDYAHLLRGQPYVDQLIVVPMEYVFRFKEFTVSSDAEKAREAYPRLFDALPKRAHKVVNLTYNAAGCMLAGSIDAPEHVGPFTNAQNEVRLNDLWSQYYLAVGADIRFPIVHWVDAFANIGGAMRENLRTEFVIQPDPQFWEAFKAQVINRNYMVIQLGASQPSKQWSHDFFIEAAKRIVAARGLTVVLVGGKGEKITVLKAERELRQAGIRVVNLVGATNFHQLATVLKGSVGLLSNDTFTQHLAAAVGVTATTVFVGDVSPWLTLGYLPGNRAVIEDDGSPPSVEKVVEAFLGTGKNHLAAKTVETYQFPMPVSAEARTPGWIFRWVIGSGHLRALDPNIAISHTAMPTFPLGWSLHLENIYQACRNGVEINHAQVEESFIRDDSHPLFPLLMMLRLRNRFSDAWGHPERMAENYRWLRQALERAAKPE